MPKGGTVLYPIYLAVFKQKVFFCLLFFRTSKSLIVLATAFRLENQVKRRGNKKKMWSHLKQYFPVPKKILAPVLSFSVSISSVTYPREDVVFNMMTNERIGRYFQKIWAITEKRKKKI